MSGKFALIIANTEYSDPGLDQLAAPSEDAEDLGRVLQSTDFCAFDDVKILLNQPEYMIRGAIDEFFDQKKPDDLLLMYFSGHGIRDDHGALYLAVQNTVRNRLRSTAIKSDYVREAMNQSRSRRQVLILDCCNSGAVEQGTKAATGVSIGTATAFEAGYGRIILTASDSTQFAWEGNKVIGETKNSLFTHFLVKGLRGEADLNRDGRITVDELYDYTYEQVRLATPKQTPSKFATKQQGEIVLGQVKDIKSLLQQNGNLRENASFLKIPSDQSQATFLESALARIKDLQLSANLKPLVQANVDKQDTPTKTNQVLRFIFWLLIVLGTLPFIVSFVDLRLQNVVFLFWILVIIFGALGARRGFTKESIILLSALLGLAFNHVFRRYVPAIANFHETDVAYLGLRIMTLEILIYVGYQASRNLSLRPSKIVMGNPFRDKLLGMALGAINGYLIAGTALFYYHVADYPFPYFIFKSSDPALLQKINSLMLYLPPQLLGEPGIYYAIILAFLFVLIVLT